MTDRPTIPERLARIDEFTFLEVVKLADMFTEPYCRPVGTAALGRMLKTGFNPRALGIITLSMRENGRFAIIDGNHRRHLAEHAGLTELLARVFIDLTYLEEAQLFKDLNTIKPPNAVDRFRADVEAQEPRALHLQAILNDFKLRVGSTADRSHPGVVMAVAAFQRVLIERGEDELREILAILRAAWDYEPAAYSARMLAGISAFWARYRSDANVSRLVAQLQTTTPNRIVAKAIGYGGRQYATDDAVGKTLVDVYIGRSRAAANQLPEWGRASNLQSARAGSVGRKALRRVEKLRKAAV